MNELVVYILLLFLAGLASFALTYFLSGLKSRKIMIAVPNERSLHEKPVPKSGGIAIVLTWYTGLTILFFFDFIEKNLYYALMSGILISVISLIDDIYDVKPVVRLLIHFITAIIAFAFLGGLRPLFIPDIHFNYNWIVYPVAIVGIVWFINLFNFMDGVDGYVSVEAIFLSAVFFIMSWNPATVLLIVCVSGFLVWNWPRARIFMGDTGSTQLGFILVIFGIYLHNTLEFSILNWIMLTSPFWFDATITLFRRWRNKEKLGKGHKKHVYQRFVRMGFPHQKVNYILIIINFFIIALIIIYRSHKVLQIPIFIFTLVMFYALTRYVDKKVPFTRD